MEGIQFGISILLLSMTKKQKKSPMKLINYDIFGAHINFLLIKKSFECQGVAGWRLKPARRGSGRPGLGGV